jgi:diguanylate cyclase (GGDEF)-like protein/PAS domain S-box-containing protein
MSDDVLNAILGSAIATDMTGRIVQANEAALTFFGYKNKELLALHIDDLISERHGMQLAIQRELLAAAPSARTVGPAQNLMAQTHDGRKVPVEVQLTLKNRGRTRHVVTTFRDRSRESELGQKLAENERQLRAISVMSTDWYWRQDADLRFTYISGWEKQTHITDARRVIGKTRSELSYVYGPDALRVEHEQTLAQRQPFQNLLIHNPDNGNYALVTGEPLFDEQGAFSGYHGVGRDVTEEKRMERELRDSETRFRALTALSSDWYWEQDADLLFTSMLGANEEAQPNNLKNVLGKSRFDLPYVWQSEAAGAEHERTLAERRPFRDLLLHNPENNRFALTSGEPIFDEHGEFCGYQGVSRDVTAEKRAEQSLQNSEARFRALASMSSDWFWEQDENLRYTYLSPIGQANAPVPIDAIIGHTRFELPLAWESEAVKQQHADTLEARQPFRDLLLSTLSGDQFTYVSGEPVFHDDGTFRGYQGVTKDVTSRKLAEAQALRLATHDALTGLPNRTLLADRLEHAIAQASRRKTYLAVLFIDIDRFKTLNDTFGHGTGDEFLRTISARLVGVMRRSDTLARFGGDEFVVVLENLRGKSDVEEIACKMLAVLSKEVELNGVPFQTTASIGISMHPDNGSDTETLLRHADLAMYESKESGRGCIHFYADEMNHRVARRTTLDRELRDAIEADQFELYFHPQHDISTDEVNVAEVLLRWNHPDRGIVAPGEFITESEENGLILPIGKFVLERTFATIAGWLKEGVEPPRLSINISSRQLLDGDTLLKQAGNLLETSGVPHDLIEFEITESLLIQRSNEASMHVLQTLGELGIRLAIDDFGTGYLSLNYLKRLPVNAIKIDPAFVSEITSNKESASIVQAIVGLAHKIKLEVIAEGVETDEQLQTLRKMGCDTFQGFLREKPMPQREFEKQFLGLPRAKATRRPRRKRTATR